MRKYAATANSTGTTENVTRARRQFIPSMMTMTPASVTTSPRIATSPLENISLTASTS